MLMALAKLRAIRPAPGLVGLQELASDVSGNG